MNFEPIIVIGHTPIRWQGIRQADMTAAAELYTAMATFSLPLNIDSTVPDS